MRSLRFQRPESLRRSGARFQQPSRLWHHRRCLLARGDGRGGISTSLRVWAFQLIGDQLWAWTFPAANAFTAAG